MLNPRGALLVAIPSAIVLGVPSAYIFSAVIASHTRVFASPLSGMGITVGVLAAAYGGIASALAFATRRLVLRVPIDDDTFEAWATTFFERRGLTKLNTDPLEYVERRRLGRRVRIHRQTDEAIVVGPPRDVAALEQALRTRMSEKENRRPYRD